MNVNLSPSLVVYLLGFGAAQLELEEEQFFNRNMFI